MSLPSPQCRVAAINPGNVKSPLTGQLPQSSNNAFEDATTFRSDYKVPPSGLFRRKPIDPLPPAAVLPKNTCYEKLNQSLTQSTYLPPGKHYVSRASVDDKEQTVRAMDMHKANFHISADKRLETRLTTNQTGFPAIVHDPRWDINQFNRYKDVESGPLGNRVYNPSAQSEYSGMYKVGEEGRVNARGAGVTRLGDNGKSCQNTLTGGAGYTGRDHMKTTHCDTFRGAPIINVNHPAESARRQRLRITGIPQGDPKKVNQLTTNTQASYLAPPPSYDKPKAVRHLNESSIILSQNSKPSNRELSSTINATSFTKPTHTEKAVPLVHFSRNTSFLPRGDLDPVRVRERVNFVTTKSAHPQPPPNCYPTHIDSSNFHTVSHFDLGDTNNPHPARAYCSTVADSYIPLSQPTHRARAPSKDNLPLHYFPSHLFRSTTADSYCQREELSGRKTNELNPVALNNLKCSHWSLPTTGLHHYSTTHRDCFTAPFNKYLNHSQ